jgi:hypothetical protein
MAKDGFTEKVFLYEVQKGMREQWRLVYKGKDDWEVGNHGVKSKKVWQPLYFR